MLTPQPPPPPPAPPTASTAATASARRGPQFSLGTLLIVMTAAAVFFGVIHFLGLRLVITLVAGMAMFVIPVCLGTLALYCRGHRQTLFLGALVGWLTPYLLGGTYGVSGFDELMTLAVLSVGWSASGGLAAVFTRRFLERRGWHLPPDSSDNRG